MEIPEIPTDNLYKFTTIFGLALIIIGVALPIYGHHYYTEVTRELMGKYLVSMSDSVLGFLKTPQTEANALAADKGMEHVNTMIQSGLRVIDAENAMKLYGRIGFSISTIGLVISLCGFYFWYTLHQKFHDLILKKQAQGKIPMTG